MERIDTQGRLHRRPKRGDIGRRTQVELSFELVDAAGHPERGSCEFGDGEGIGHPLPVEVDASPIVAKGREVVGTGTTGVHHGGEPIDVVGGTRVPRWDSGQSSTTETSTSMLPRVAFE
jgi:hypothetical protein